MLKTAKIAFIVLLTLIIAGSCYAQNYPKVECSYNPGDFTYTYTVTVTPQDDFAFGYLQIDTMVENAGITSWTIYKPEVDGVELQDWQTSWTTWDSVNHYDSAIWFTPDHLNPGDLTSDWVAKFILCAPNTKPVDGYAITMDGGIESQYVFETEVAGPGGLIPEPAGIASLGMAVIGLGGSLIRRRRI